MLIEIWPPKQTTNKFSKLPITNLYYLELVLIYVPQEIESHFNYAIKFWVNKSQISLIKILKEKDLEITFRITIDSFLNTKNEMHQRRQKKITSETPRIFEAIKAIFKIKLLRSPTKPGLVLSSACISA